MNQFASQIAMLYPSFWKLALSNLPVGRFAHSLISAGEAFALLSAARSNRALICVSQDDLAAPVRSRELERHRECAPLSSQGLEVAMTDFAGPSSINPLSLASVRDGNRLLIVHCGYVFASTKNSLGAEWSQAKAEELHGKQIGVSRRLTLVPDTITFHLIEAADEDCT